MLLLPCAYSAPSQRSRRVPIWVLTLPARYFQRDGIHFSPYSSTPSLTSYAYPAASSLPTRISVATCVAIRIASLYSCSSPSDKNHFTTIRAVFGFVNASMKSRCVRRGVGMRPLKAHLSSSNSSQSNTICEAVSIAPLPQRHCGVDTPGTFLANRNALNPIFPVRICTSRELSCFRSFSYFFSDLSDRSG